MFMPHFRPLAAIDFEPQTICGNSDGFGDWSDYGCSTYSVMMLFLPIDDSIGLALLINFLMNDDYPSSLPKSSHVSNRDG